MAEGFARKYGADVIHSWSGGLAPAAVVQPLTLQVMSQKNIDIQEQFPKSIHELELNSFDLIVNMSGAPLPAAIQTPTLTWAVADPMTQAEEVYIKVRDQIEGLVMQLILELRRNGLKTAEGTPVKTDRIPAAPVQTPVQTRVRTPAAPELDRTSQSSQRYGFGRVRRARD
jgi:arsenate reductase